MGFFSRKKKLGQFVLRHYAEGELVVENSLTWSLSIINFALYLDRLVYDIGGFDGERLWRLLFDAASEVFEDVVRADTGEQLEERRFHRPMEFRVVSDPPGSEPLVETAILVEKGCHYFCELTTRPIAAEEPEETLIQGCEALFAHLFNHGDKGLKFFLPVVVLAQCNWYDEHGLPSISKITAAPYAGFAAMQALTSQGVG